MLFINKLRP